VERVVVTGAGGFVGGKLVQRLLRPSDAPVQVDAWIRSDGADADWPPSVSTSQVDITDGARVGELLEASRPGAVVHLAAFSELPNETADLELMWRTNLDGVVSIAESLLRTNPEAWLFLVSSGMVYGDRPGRVVSEDDFVAPSNLYAASKYASEVALRMLVGRGLKLCVLRPFNHSGPGQRTAFFIPALIARILRIEQGMDDRVLTLRNAHNVRDYLHVDDVVECYAKAYYQRNHLKPGVTLNVCSGAPISVREIAEYALSISEVPDCEIVEDNPPTRFGDVTGLVGNNSRALELLQWAPQADARKMVLDTYLAMKRLDGSVGPDASRAR